MNMAENPNDKALREKLLSAEYAYDPQAWAAMEQLMERKKKRGFLWWWLASGAVAVALLVSAGVYYGLYESMHAHGPVAANSKSVAEPSQAAISGTTNQSTEDVKATTQSESATNASKAAPTDKTTKARSTSSSSDLQPFSKQKTQNRKQAHATHISHTAPIAADHAPTVTAVPGHQVAADDLTPGAGTLLATDKKNWDLAPDGASTQAIPLHHKHKVSASYSLGAETGIFESYTRRTFASVPTWSAGLSQQLAISKYFAITNSILYSEVNFKINRPAYPDNQYSDLMSFTSHIQELAIPIGIKVYPYTSRHLRLSVGVSYVNHIKVNESFTYQFKPKTPPATFAPADVADFPDVNNFEPGKAISSINAAADQLDNGKLMKYYSLGNGKRYYGSMLYTLGVDILLPHRISISAEPAMRMSIEQIQMQHSRVFDFGINTAIRYTF